MPLDLTAGVEGLYAGLYPFGLSGSGYVPPAEPDLSQFLPGTPTFDSGVGQPFSSSEIRTYVRKFKVGTINKAYANVVTMVRHPIVPLPYVSYISANGQIVDPSALAVSIRADLLVEGDWQWWVVTVEYSTEMPEGGPNPYVQWPDKLLGPANRPWEERPTLTVDVEETSEAFPADLDGKPYWTSARTPLEPAPVRPVEHVVYVFERNMPTFMVTPVIIGTYHNAVNDRTFLSRPAGCVKCSFKPGPLRYRGRIPYYRPTLTFRLKLNNIPDPTKTGPDLPTVPETWQTNYIDADTHRLMTIPGTTLFGVSLKNMPIPLTIAGQPVSKPYPLDGFGQPLRPAVDGKMYPVYLNFRDWKSADLQVLFGNMG